jgi:hypothetical protein
MSGGRTIYILNMRLVHQARVGTYWTRNAETRRFNERSTRRWSILCFLKRQIARIRSGLDILWSGMSAEDKLKSIP